MPGPLEGVKIVDMTTVIMGPYATQMLGDMGADVVKIESVQGDVLRFSNRGRNHGMGNIFLNHNRNKRSLALDLKAAAGREALLKLVAQSDVFVCNLRPRTMARLGLAYEDLAAVNSQIVYVGCFGFGQAGPYADRPAYDDLIQAMTGITNLFEKAYGEDPKFIPSNICDRVTGLNVVNAITAALFYRERTGEGQSIEIPMYETMIQFLMADHLGGYTFVPPLDEIGYTRLINPNRRPFPTKDGYIALLVYNNKQWAQFFEIIGRPEMTGQGIFADQSSRGNNIVEVYGFVQAELAQRTTAEWLELLGRTEIPHTAVPQLEELFEDEHLEAVGFFPEVEHPSEGRIRMTAVPSHWSASQPDVRRHAPRLGEHSAEILAELGYSAAEIEALVEFGVTSLMR